MSSNLANQKKLISDAIRSLAKKNKAKSYSSWLNDKTLDARIKVSGDIVDASTIHALEGRDFKNKSELHNTGYGKYLSDMSKAKYLSATAKARDGAVQNTEKSIDAYTKYVTALDDKRRALVDSAFKTIVNQGVTDVTEAYRKALSAGLSPSDAKAVAKDTTSLTRTDLYRKAVSNIITRYYTSAQAKEYARAIGLSEKDANELGRVAEILNQLPSNQEFYSSDYAEYIEALKNTKK